MKRFNASDISIPLRMLPSDRDPGARSFKAVFGVESSVYNNSHYVE